jgi:ElaB/YqjD/DUF883 family membrane-anchored ribosome-binding protein
MNGSPRRGGEMQNLLKDVEEMLGRTMNIDDADIRALHQRVTASAEAARDSLRGTAARIQDKAVSVAHTADDYAHESPWALVGFAAAAGLLTGMLATRR